MRLFFLGTGRIFSQNITDYPQTGLLVEFSEGKGRNQSLLIDVPEFSGQRLLEYYNSNPLNLTSLKYILITHEHHDHIAGLPSLLATLYYHSKIKSNKSHRVNIITTEKAYSFIRYWLLAGRAFTEKRLNDFVSFKSLPFHSTTLNHTKLTASLEIITVPLAHSTDVFGYCTFLKNQVIAFLTDGRIIDEVLDQLKALTRSKDLILICQDFISGDKYHLGKQGFEALVHAIKPRKIFLIHRDYSKDAELFSYVQLLGVDVVLPAGGVVYEV